MRVVLKLKKNCLKLITDVNKIGDTRLLNYLGIDY